MTDTSELLPGDRVVAFEARALGSPLRLQVRVPETAYAGDEARAVATRAWDEVTAEFAAVDRALSRFRDDSELTALNRIAGSGRVVRVSWRVRETVALMGRASRLTDRRFDPTFLPDLERLGEHGAVVDAASPAEAPGSAPDDGAAPDPDAIPDLLDRLDRPRAIVVPPVPLDTGGIGKGLALRWAARRAAAVLPPDAGLLLEAGGDIVVAGEPPPASWRIGVEDPVTAGTPGAEPLVVVLADHGAVSTSSVRVRNWTAPDGRRVHHLLDPRTREPARTGLLAVTVAHADPAWGEVWTKALFLAGRDAIGDEARARGMAAWWVTDAGTLGMTPAARELCAWVAEGRLG